MIWHSASLEEVKNELRTNDTQGLNAEEVRRRQEEYGPNRLREPEGVSFGAHFSAQLRSAPIILFFIAAALSVLAHLIYPADTLIWLEPVVSVALTLLFALWSALQARKAEQDLETLNQQTIPTAQVIRDGVQSRIPADQLVPGDLILLKTGDYIPADARLVQVHALRCDESALSGEEVPVEKQLSVLPEDIAPIPERLNMVFAGCAVTFGEGMAIVTDIGMDAERGKKEVVRNLVDTEDTPLQEDIQKFAGLLTPAVWILSGLLLLVGLVKSVILGLFFNGNLMAMAVGSLFSISALAICIYPAMLLVTAITVLAVGVRRIHRQNAVIRRLSTVSALSKVSVLCCEKTDCLTTGEMVLREIFNGKEICRFSDDSTPDETSLTVLRWAAVGCDIDLHASPERENATDAAILNAAEQYCGLSRSDAVNIFPKTVLLPFDPQRRMMSTVNVIDGTPYAVVKGAPEVLLSKCTGGNLEAALAAQTQMGDSGLRVIAVGVKALEATPANPLPEDLECDLTLIGLVGLLDPPLPQAAEQVAVCKQAGILPVMVTGDHLSTATALAQHIGILTDDTVAITGSALAQLSDEDLEAGIEKYTVYARVTPHDKRRIVRAWQNRGCQVAVTGERVDDDATLALADVGCALGASGTDVATEASDLVLCDDRFPTLVRALSGARTIFFNLRKTLQFFFTTGVALTLTALFSVIALEGNAPLLHPLQMLLAALLFGGMLSFALSLEPDNGDAMRRPAPKSLFAGHLWVTILWQGLMLGVLTVTAFLLGNAAYGGGASAAFTASEAGTTMAFCVLALGQLLLAFHTRSDYSIFHVGPHTNLPFLLAAVLDIALFLVILLTPGLQTVAGLCPLTEGMWETVVLLLLFPLVVPELVKLGQLLWRKTRTHPYRV